MRPQGGANANAKARTGTTNQELQATAKEDLDGKTASTENRVEERGLEIKPRI